MTLDYLYRDVYSAIDFSKLEHNIYELDIIKAINDACVSVRAEYLKAGRFQGFIVREDVYATTPDYFHPYLNSIDLTYSIAPELTPQEAVIACTASLITAGVPNSAIALTTGDERSSAGVIYEAVSTSGSINASTLKFDGRVKNIYEDNDLYYEAGDIVLDNDGTFWKIKINFTNSNITIGNATYFEEVFLESKQSNYVTPVFYPFERLSTLKLIRDMDKQIGFSINGSKLYATPNANRFVLEYVPEWTDVTDRDETLPITRLIAAQVKQEALRLLEFKAKKQLTDNRVKQNAE